MNHETKLSINAEKEMEDVRHFLSQDMVLPSGRKFYDYAHLAVPEFERAFSKAMATRWIADRVRELNISERGFEVDNAEFSYDTSLIKATVRFQHAKTAMLFKLTYRGEQ